MEKNVIKIKFSTFITIIIVSIIIVGGIIAFALCKESKDNNDGNNIEIVNEESNNKEKFIKIRYAYTYNVATADALNEINEDGEYIDILEINLEGKTLEKVTSLLEKQSYKKIENLMLAVMDVYEVNINDEIKLSITPGRNYAQYNKGKESFIIKISEELVNEIDRIVQEEASKNIGKFSSEKITIISEDNNQVTITDEEYIKQLEKNSKHTKVNINEDELNDEKINYIVDLNNGTKIYVYFASCLGKVVNENGKNYYVAFIGDYENIVEIMFENYVSGRNEKIKTEEILVKYLGKEYSIKDKDEVKSIIDKLKVCEYNTYDWLEDFTEEDYGEEDIVIIIGNNKVIIPGNSGIGNRYYIDEEENAYMISGLNELEKYFKELVDYKN